MCWDPLERLAQDFESGMRPTCDSIGLWRTTDSHTYLDDWLAKINDWKSDKTELMPIKWNHALALSAGRFVECNQGCSNNFAWSPDTVNLDHNLISELATFTDHHQYFVYPERMAWQDPKEMIFEFMTTQLYRSMERDDWTGFENQADSIGMACDCHPTYGYFCVIELAKDITPKYSQVDTGLFGGEGQHKVPQFNAFYNGHCQTNDPWFYAGRSCQNQAVTEDGAQFVEGFQSEPHNYDDMSILGLAATDVMIIFNDIREFGFSGDESETRTDPFGDPYTHEQGGLHFWLGDTDANEMYLSRVAFDEVFDNSDGEFGEFEWSEALANSAKHVINDKGPCGTSASLEGDSYDEVLRKYYSYNYTDLHVAEFNFNIERNVDLNDDNVEDTREDLAIELANHILDQDHIRNDILLWGKESSPDRKHFFAIACACDVHKFDWSNQDEMYLCAVILANHVEPNF